MRQPVNRQLPRRPWQIMTHSTHVQKATLKPSGWDSRQCYLEETTETNAKKIADSCGNWLQNPSLSLRPRRAFSRFQVQNLSASHAVRNDLSEVRICVAGRNDMYRCLFVETVSLRQALSQATFRSEKGIKQLSVSYGQAEQAPLGLLALSVWRRRGLRARNATAQKNHLLSSRQDRQVLSKACYVGTASRTSFL